MDFDEKTLFKDLGNIQLYTSDMTKHLTEHAKEKRLVGHKAFILEHQNGHSTYVLFCFGRPVYDNQNAEAMFAHMDMLYLANQCDNTL